jgi:prolyl oligopeptidase
MPELLRRPPVAKVEPVTDLIHGVPVADPYRWLEDGDSPETRAWIKEQSAFAREYLDALPGREGIESRIRELLEVTTYDSLLVAKQRYVFRKRLPTQEQPCIYVREGANGADRLLVDPSGRGAGAYTSVKPVAISPNGKSLAYEVKEGGERTSRVEMVDLHTGAQLPERLPHGYLRAFSFVPDSQAFYYSVEPADQSRPFARVLFRHKLGEPVDHDEIIFAGEAENTRIGVVSGTSFQLILVQRASERILTHYYLRSHEPDAKARKILEGIDSLFIPQFAGDRILALTDLGAPNLRIVEVRLYPGGTHDFFELVPTQPALIQQWLVVAGHMAISYLEGSSFKVCIFDLSGSPLREIPLPEHKTIRLICACPETDEILFESESFFHSVCIHRYSISRNEETTWADAAISLDPTFVQRQIWYESKDGTPIPMFLVGRRDVQQRFRNPVIMTSYGGFQTSMTPQFSVLVAFLMERGCLFALPSIRGGAEFGAEWHAAAQRHNRQKAFDDFLAAAEWLGESGVAASGKIAIFGGSNSGLLVGAALTQAPARFRAVVCMAPLLDMVRYHLFDGAGKWIEEYGTAEDPNDFAVLWSYSPYHRVADKVPYPAVMMISGDADQKCNPLHARKMVARMQAATSSRHPVILDYSKYRGHTPVLPLSVRIKALTDRMAFLCDRLEI